MSDFLRAQYRRNAEQLAAIVVRARAAGRRSARGFDLATLETAAADYARLAAASDKDLRRHLEACRARIAALARQEGVRL